MELEEDSASASSSASRPSVFSYALAAASSSASSSKIIWVHRAPDSTQMSGRQDCLLFLSFQSMGTER
jgi:hypothetical protein